MNNVNDFKKPIFTIMAIWVSTDKSVSEAHNFESVNPQYDERLFIELQEKYKFTILWFN